MVARPPADAAGEPGRRVDYRGTYGRPGCCGLCERSGRPGRVRVRPFAKDCCAPIGQSVVSFWTSYRIFSAFCLAAVLIWWNVLSSTLRLALRSDAYTHIPLIVPLSAV